LFGQAPIEETFLLAIVGEKEIHIERANQLFFECLERKKIILIGYCCHSFWINYMIKVRVLLLFAAYWRSN
jgi:hypothetical protein